MSSKSYLTIHVINSGIGESIIIQLPNSQWGVVDCYSPSLLNPTENSTLQFLTRNNVKELEEEAINHVSQYTSNIAATCLKAIPFTIEKVFENKVNYGFKEKMALRMTFLNFKHRPRYELGICSFSFDEEGNCINEHFSGNAGYFTLPEKGANDV